MTSPVVAQWPSGMQTPGLAGHSASAAHARQIFVMSQIGFVAVVQSVFARHPTQPPVGAQTGVPALTPEHSAVPLTQPRHVFVLMSQTGFVPTLQSESAAHSTHAPDAPQTGAPASAPPQSPVVHPRHILVVLSQIGFVPEQEMAVHSEPPCPPFPPFPPKPSRPPSDGTQVWAPGESSMHRLPAGQSWSVLQAPGRRPDKLQEAITTTVKTNGTKRRDTLRSSP
jgi:hypothetical protein